MVEQSPSRQSLERAGFRSRRSVMMWIGLGAGALVGAGAVAAVVLQGGTWAAGGEADALASDAGADAFTSRPIEIGMPVIIARHIAVVPAAEENYPGARVPRARPGAPRLRPPRGEPLAAPVAPEAQPSRDPAAASGGEPAEPAATRTFGADDNPAAQAAALAFQESARDAVQRQYLGVVEGCFEQAGTAGSITIGFLPADDGRVIGSRVIHDTTGQDVGACVAAAAARSWRLPAPPRNALELQMSFGR